MNVHELLEVDGFKEKTANKLYNGIKDKIETANLITIMSSSNIFGRGFSEKKMELIIDSYPNVLLSKETNAQKISNITEIKGMAKKTAETFVERIPYFIHFIKETQLVKKLVQENADKKTVNNSHPLFGKTIVMTGFRDSKLQDALKNVGAKHGTSVSKNTFIVLVKDNIDSDDTGKANDAKKLGVPLMTHADFVNKYI